MMLEDHIHLLIAHYGYWMVAGVVALESMGLPLPGETTLVLAAIYAGTTHRLDIVLVIAAATVGAVIGDNIGFWIGRRIGFPLAVRYGHYIGLTESRLKLGQYLFLRHGGKVVFFGRFVALLRILAAFLAGTNRMPFPKFLLYNAAGGLIWAIVFGTGAYLLGDRVLRLAGTAGAVLLVVFVLLVLKTTLLLRHHEARLQAEADRALPDLLAEAADRP
jgi:membrane protein DedA with SNARE-associated domain